MELKLRGIVEKEIDVMLLEENLDILSRLLEKFKPLIKSKEDAMFGHLISSIESALIHYALDLYKREPTKIEIEEMVKIIIRRAPEIRSKVLIATSK